MPSANPLGRPIKPKPTPPASFEQALARELGGEVEVTINRKPTKMPRVQALAMMLMNDLERPSTTPSTRMRLIKDCLAIVPTILHAAPNQPSQETVEEVVRMLAEEYDKNEAKAKAIPPQYR
ncbi:hypothetical protein [Sphingomonas bacterium]|uniref:hypothetical protein n=1 Tax=Sphingomonas bacterium TaxID=1895847 RepID=UPI0034A06CD5